MKKFYVLLLSVLALATVQLIAQTNKVSVGGFYSFETIDSIIIDSTEIATDAKANTLGGYIKGTSFLSPTSSLGINYMARFGKVTSMEIGGTSVDTSEEPIGWDFMLGLVIQQPLEMDSFFELGGGIVMSLDSETDNSGSIPVETTLTLFSLSLLAEINYSLDPSTYLNIGVQGLIPLFGTIEGSSGGITMSYDYSIDGFTLSPYVGVSVAY
nr:hypothetical protein [uncultured Sphaerochaeta sp.]